MRNPFSSFCGLLEIEVHKNESRVWSLESSPVFLTPDSRLQTGFSNSLAIRALRSAMMFR